MRKGYLPKKLHSLSDFRKVFDQLAISDSGLLMKGDKLRLPDSLTKSALQKAHQGGHPGMGAMKRRLRAHFWFPKMNSYIEESVGNCKECLMFTSKNRKNKLIPQDMSSRNAWEKVSVDLFGPMPDKRHIVVAQDMVSRFPAAKIVNKTDANHIVGALEDFYTNYGTPLIHRTDNGPPFNSQEFTQFSKNNGIEHEKTFPYHPQANPVEAFMKPLGKAMKAAHFNKQCKAKVLDKLLSSYRATPHSATGISPGDILFRHGYCHDFPKVSDQSDKLVREALEHDGNTKQDRNNKKNINRKNENYNIGDRVYTKNHSKTKFEPTFGPVPMIITGTRDGGVECTDGYGMSQRRHLDDVKLAENPNNQWWTFSHSPTNQQHHTEEDPSQEQHTTPLMGGLETNSALAMPMSTHTESPRPTGTDGTERGATATEEVEIQEDTDTSAQRRSTRTRKPPPRFEDYVTR